EQSSYVSRSAWRRPPVVAGGEGIFSEPTNPACLSCDVLQKDPASGGKLQIGGPSGRISRQRLNDARSGIKKLSLEPHDFTISIFPPSHFAPDFRIGHASLPDCFYPP